MKQGIVTILRSDCERTEAASIWRTLSAHMSSKKWLGWFFNPIKKINASSEDSSSFSYEKVPRQDDVWRSIQSHKERNYRMKKAEELDVWGSILTDQKSPQNSSNVPPPYVHPDTTLSEKSTEICTESLGSETGSNCFSSHPCSEISSDADEDHRQRVVQQEININPLEDLRVAKYRKSQVRPFPPPLPSISGGYGASIHMHSHRKNGRLVLEAVYVPPRKHFHAHRREGRLVLTLTSSPSSQENEVRGDW